MVIRYFNKIAVWGLVCLFFLMPPGGAVRTAAQEPPESDTAVSPFHSDAKTAGFSALPLEGTSGITSALPESDRSGRRAVSLDLRGIEITELLKVLSKKLGKNIIASKNVTGRVNLFLDDISYEDVLDIVMISQGLAYEEQEKNVIIVMTEAEYESLYGRKFNEKRKMITLKLRHAEPQMVFNALNNLKSNIGKIILDEVTGTMILIDIPEKLKDMKKIFDDLDSPPVTEVFELQYAQVADVKDGISSIITEGSGSILTDERTNVLIITDLPGNMRKIKQAINVLDQETRQVFIEAAIVQITLEDDLTFGIEWEKIMKDPSIWGTVLTGSFPATGLTSAYQRITLGTLDDNQFTLAINFLNTLGDTKILSKPRIAVTNNEEATIHVGKREAIVTGTTSQSGESTITSDNVEFVDIGIKLTVVPTINRDNFITMKIKPEVSSVTSEVRTGTEDEPRSIIPIITTSEAETTVKIKDGSMIMIAGLKENNTSKNVDGVPFLCDIPVLGALFSNRKDEKSQTEIVIFLTPHIIRGEQMMSWDLQKLKEYPKKMWPENRGYFEPKFKASSLRKTRKTGR